MFWLAPNSLKIKFFAQDEKSLKIKFVRAYHILNYIATDIFKLDLGIIMGIVRCISLEI